MKLTLRWDSTPKTKTQKKKKSDKYQQKKINNEIKKLVNVTSSK